MKPAVASLGAEKTVGALGVLLLFLSCDPNPIKSGGSATPTPGVPEAPTAVTAIAGNTEVAVSWSAPASDGGSAITGYKAIVVEDSSKYCLSSGETYCVVTGLYAGMAYTLVVNAINAVGAGPSSSPYALTTPAILPSAPILASVVAGDSQAIVSWAAPLSNGGSPIIGYAVVAVEDSTKGCYTESLACTVTGLTNDSVYRFYVKAVNAVGTGPASAASDSVIPVAKLGSIWVGSASHFNYQSMAWNGWELFASWSNTDRFPVDGGVNIVLGGENWINTWKNSGSFNTQYRYSLIHWTGSQFVYIVGINQIISSHSGAYPENRYFTSPDGFSWTRSDSVPTSAQFGPPLRSVASNGIQTVAVGDQGFIATSPDGVRWVAQKLGGISYVLRAVVWMGSQFVVVGDNSGVLTSPDGMAWLWHDANLPIMKGLVWTGDRLVAVGVNGGIRTSVDGLSWESRSSGVTSDLSGIAVADGQLVAVGSGGAIVTSRDGVTWRKRNSGTNRNLYAIAWTGKKLVVLGDGVILESPQSSP